MYDIRWLQPFMIYICCLEPQFYLLAATGVDDFQLGQSFLNVGAHLDQFFNRHVRAGKDVGGAAAHSSTMRMDCVHASRFMKWVL